MTATARSNPHRHSLAIAAPPRRVGVFGLDNFSRKNRTQLLGLNARGYHFDVFSNDAFGDSADNLPPGNTFSRLARGPIGRLRQLARYLQAHATSLNHVEIYPGGRFAGMYATLARLWGIPSLVVERGDLLYEGRYGAVTRHSMRLCYRLATRVWYRELYQEKRLKELGARSLFFLSNAVTVPPPSAVDAERPLDFLWVNRLIVERRADWVVDVLASPAFASARGAMLGLLQGRAVDAGMLRQQDYVAANCPPNLTLHEFQDPTALYRRARFFVLPSDIVFCNNALLEAMAHGVVPLVSDVEGARLIVDDGIDGIVFPHTPEGLRSAMARALTLPANTWAAMSARAAEKVRTRFSVDQWADRLATEYVALGGSPEDR